MTANKYNAIIADGVAYYLSIQQELDKHGRCYFISRAGEKLAYAGSIKPVFSHNIENAINTARLNGFIVLSAESDVELGKLIRNASVFPQPINNPRAMFGKIARKQTDKNPGYLEVDYNPGDLLWFISTSSKLPIVCAPVEFVNAMWDLNRKIVHYHFQGYLDEEGKSPDEVFPTAFELYAAMTCKGEKALTVEELIAAAKEVE